MKISKSQQAVVNKMRDGYSIGVIESRFTICVLMKPLYPAIIVDYETFNTMLNTGVIEKIMIHDCEIYRLTEQYKNEQK